MGLIPPARPLWCSVGALGAAEPELWVLGAGWVELM